MTETRTLAGMRRELGYTQARVAEVMGISQGQLSRIEAAYPDVKFPALRAYLEAIGMSVEFNGWGFGPIDSHGVVQDPERELMRERRRNDPTRGGPKPKPSGADSHPRTGDE